MKNIWIYILISAAVTYLIRVTPLVLIRREIKNRTVRSFLHYVPYACLTAMTFPAILDSGSSMISGAAALAVAGVLAFLGRSLVAVALGASAALWVMEWILLYIL